MEQTNLGPTNVENNKLDVEKTLWGLLSEQDKTNDKLKLIVQIIDQQMRLLSEKTTLSDATLAYTSNLRRQLDQIDGI